MRWMRQESSGGYSEVGCSCCVGAFGVSVARASRGAGAWALLGASHRRDTEHLRAVKALAEKISPTSQKRDRTKAAGLIQTADAAIARVEARGEELAAAAPQAEASTSDTEVEGSEAMNG